MQEVIRRQHAISPEDLIQESAYILGFKQEIACLEVRIDHEKNYIRPVFFDVN